MSTIVNDTFFKHPSQGFIQGGGGGGGGGGGDQLLPPPISYVLFKSKNNYICLVCIPLAAKLLPVYALFLFIVCSFNNRAHE